jgi:2'-5' RNA ligase
MSFADLAPGEHATAMRNHWWWRPGWHVGQRAYTWHLTFENQSELWRLVNEYQRALASFSGLDLIPRQWLHLTVQGIGFTSATMTDDVEHILKAAQRRLAALPRVVLNFHAPVVADEAVVLPPDEESTVSELRRAIRSAIADAVGTENVSESGDHFRPHVSLAYSNREQEAAPILEAIQATSVKPARLSIPTASLIVIHRDHRVYQWETVAKVPIGTP